jgi:hypothetical protein
MPAVVIRKGSLSARRVFSRSAPTPLVELNTSAVQPTSLYRWKVTVPVGRGAPSAGTSRATSRTVLLLITATGGSAVVVRTGVLGATAAAAAGVAAAVAAAGVATGTRQVPAHGDVAVAAVPVGAGGGPGRMAVWLAVAGGPAPASWGAPSGARATARTAVRTPSRRRRTGREEAQDGTGPDPVERLGPRISRLAVPPDEVTEI